MRGPAPGAQTGRASVRGTKPEAGQSSAPSLPALPHPSFCQRVSNVGRGYPGPTVGCVRAPHPKLLHRCLSSSPPSRGLRKQRGGVSSDGVGTQAPSPRGGDRGGAGIGGGMADDISGPLCPWELLGKAGHSPPPAGSEPAFAEDPQGRQAYAHVRTAVLESCQGGGYSSSNSGVQAWGSKGEEAIW